MAKKSATKRNCSNKKDSPRNKKKLTMCMKKSPKCTAASKVKQKTNYERSIQLIKESRKCQVKRKSFNDSVIILSDNETEESRKMKSTNQNNVTDKNIQSSLGQLFKSFQCLRKASKYPVPNTTTPKAGNNKSKKKNTNESFNLDASCLIISDSTNLKSDVSHKNFTSKKSSSNKLNETNEDVVIVWSSITNSKDKSTSGNKGVEAYVSDEENQPRLFMLDYNGDCDNLKCLQSTFNDGSQRHNEKAKESYNNDLLFNKPSLQLPDCSKPSFSVSVQPQEKIKKISARIRAKKLNTLQVQHQESTNKVQYQQPTNRMQSQESTNRVQYQQPTNRIQYQESTNRIQYPEPITSQQPNEPVPNNRVGKLREIIIDGCNVAMAYTQGKTFSEAGLKLVIDYFQQRGHSVKAFVPQHKRSLSHPLLEKLYVQGIVVFTPSRTIAGKCITPYDDRLILEYATLCKGIVISLDQYRDLYREKPEWRDTIENRLLAPTFVGNYVLFPDDPLGRNGPTLDQFLRHDS